MLKTAYSNSVRKKSMQKPTPGAVGFNQRSTKKTYDFIHPNSHPNRRLFSIAINVALLGVYQPHGFHARDRTACTFHASAGYPRSSIRLPALRHRPGLMDRNHTPGSTEDLIAATGCVPIPCLPVRLHLYLGAQR